MRIRPARSDEGERLREIAIAAKSHWGYDPGGVREWAAQGDFTPNGLRAKDVDVAESDGRVVAWACGVGSLLFQHAVDRARSGGANRLEWEAEPNAVGFYEKLGGRYLRDSEPSAWGRVIPVMGIDL